jgi:hypothetical protein
MGQSLSPIAEAFLTPHSLHTLRYAIKMIRDVFDLVDAA